MVLTLVALSACGGGEKTVDVVVDPTGPPFAKLVELTEAPPLSGLEVQGISGDWMLQNERLAVVIQGLGNQTGFALTGGNLVDAAPAGGRDLLGGTFLFLHDRFGRQAVYTSLEQDESDTVGVTLLARGHDSEDHHLELETRYVLRPGWDYVEIRTVFRNTGPDSLLDYALGDGIEWGRARSYAPGPGRNLPGTNGTIPYLCGAAEGTAYAWWSPEGDFTGPHSPAWSDPVGKTVDILPDSEAEYVRRLTVVSGSVADAVRRVALARGEATVSGMVTVRGENGGALAGASVEAFDSEGMSRIWGETGADGRVVLALAEGTYDLTIGHPRRGSVVREGVSFSPDHAPEIELSLKDPARLVLRSVDGSGDPCPARWTFEGTGETPSPDLGPLYAADGAGPYVLSATGETRTRVPAGSYRVTASRGPIYEIWQKDVDLSPGKEVTLEAELTRVPVPVGWVSGDFHVHCLKSPDSGVSLPDRARSLVCEGVDWFAATDHDYRTDYTSVLDTLALAASLKVLMSEEITTFNFGHFNAFPLEADTEAPGRGAVPILGTNPERIFTGLRDEGDVLIQINHPRSRTSGYFSLVEDPLLFDFEMMEIANGRESSIDAVWADWMAALRSGRRVVGVGNSDSHFLVGQEVGYPRNYVQVDSAFVGDPDSLVAALRRGRVVAGYGPFIDLTLEGESVGSTVIHREGKLTGHIRVIAPTWIDVSEVAVIVDGEDQIVFKVRERDREVRFDEDFDVTMHASGFVLVRVTGEESMHPVLTEDGNLQPVLPLAFTNPVWVRITGSS